ncbi:MAG TPA: hypothetical protein VHM31_23255 [Polyangia bacterium]|nr:hypothetical protein [Polyangia bacterium]
MAEPRRLRPPRALIAVLALLSGAVPAAGQARAATHRPAAHHVRAGKKAPRPPKVVPNQEGKVVVFPFKDDDDHSIGAQIERLLRARGLEVMTGVRRVDTAEQYRDMATTLGLAAYVDGALRESPNSARVTVSVRSGYSGRKVVSITFKETPLHLRAEIEDKLWTKLGPAMSRACADATKPRRRGRGPLLIEAGTPLAPDG